MELETFIRHFENAIDDVDVGTLSPDTVFRDLKSWDSLAVLTVTDTIDMECGVLLKKEDFAKAVTLEDLYGLVVNKLGA